MNPPVRSSSLTAAALEVFRQEVRELATSLRGLFLIVLHGGVALFAAWGLIALDRSTGGKMNLLASQAATLGASEQAAVLERVEEAGVVSTGLAKALLEARLPPLLIGVLLASTVLLPALLVLVGHDRLSDDLSSRHARYVLQRVDRFSWLAGKLLALWSLSFGAVLVGHVALLFAGLVEHADTVAACAPALPALWCGLAVSLLAYSAYVLCVSTLVQPPVLALLASLGGLALIRVVTFFLGLDAPWLGRLWMGAWDVELWLLDPVALVIHLGYAALFGGLAGLALARRDV
jgi:hypothetical protein